MPRNEEVLGRLIVQTEISHVNQTFSAERGTQPEPAQVDLAGLMNQPSQVGPINEPGQDEIQPSPAPEETTQDEVQSSPAPEET